MSRFSQLKSALCSSNLAVLGAWLALELPVNATAEPLEPDAPMECRYCDAWNAPQKPFRVFGNTWYVGPAGLTSLLVSVGEEDGQQALVLLDGGLSQSAAVIQENMNTLGFDLANLKVILNSHAHFDHSGGIAALQRASGARVIASEPALKALRTGQVPAHDPQAGYAPDNGFPPIANLEVLADGESFKVGEVSFTLHLTPGHTPGSTSWSWESCENDFCTTVLYADSMNSVSSPEFRYSNALPELGGASTAEVLEESIGFLRAFDCGVLISPHPMYFNVQDKLAARADSDLSTGENPFYAPEDCAKLADRFETALHKRLENEAQEAP